MLELTVEVPTVPTHETQETTPKRQLEDGMTLESSGETLSPTKRVRVDDPPKSPEKKPLEVEIVEPAPTHPSTPLGSTAAASTRKARPEVEEHVFCPWVRAMAFNIHDSIIDVEDSKIYIEGMNDIV